MFHEKEPVLNFSRGKLTSVATSVGKHSRVTTIFAKETVILGMGLMWLAPLTV